MSRPPVRTALLAGATLLLAGCGARTDTDGFSAERASAASKPLGYVGSRESAAAPASLSDRKLVRSAEAEIVVARATDAIDAARGAVRKHGGTVADAQMSRDEAGRVQAMLRFAVPAERFDEFLADVRRLGDVRSEHEGTQDVTKEYFDRDSRLRAKRQTEEQLREILRTRTGKLSDVLEVERELDRVVGEIEGMEGEQRFTDRQVAYATLAVHLAERETIVERGALRKVGDAFRESLGVLMTSVAFLAYAAGFATPWVVLGGAGWAVVRWRRRRAAL